jgi:hypothetical protein
MFYNYIFFLIYKILTLYNNVCLTLFKMYFKPYYYKTRAGDIIECKYITYDEIIPSNSYYSTYVYETPQYLMITYECDKSYNCYNRTICDPEKYLLTPHNIYTNYVFTNISLIFEDHNLTLYLRTKQYNFYICNNVINSDFILYYLQNILHIFIEKQYLFNTFYEDNLSYELIIIDHCFKQHKLTHTDTIILHKNTFEVIKNNNNNNKLK